MMNPLEHSVCLEFPIWLEQTAWAEHIPFAMFAVSVIRPRVFVELGSFRGVSYCAFCQAVKSLKLDTKCYAIDSWEGDAHAGMLEKNAFALLENHHNPLYSNFSTLVRATFDEALPNFADHSVDLLHIDGFHSYEAVKHDFETWLPKLSDRAIVLFHDTNVRERDFGVWKYWLELTQKCPHFEFIHGHGLGVLAVGKDVPPDCDFLFSLDENGTTKIRDFFYQLGMRIESTINLREQAALTQRQQQYIEILQSYEKTVNKSIVMRIYRKLIDDGIGSLFNKK